MSKAFTKESDEEAETPLPPLPSASLPAGAKNYVTPDGAERMHAVLAQWSADRPALAAEGDEASAKQRLRRLDQRIAQLQEGLRSAEITPPSGDCADSVCFGAMVTVLDPLGEFACYRIVGVDEADAERGWVSWLSPIARALINARRGDRVRFKRPSGETELEIADIRYDAGGPPHPLSV